MQKFNLDSKFENYIRTIVASDSNAANVELTQKRLHNNIYKKIKGQTKYNSLLRIISYFFGGIATIVFSITLIISINTTNLINQHDSLKSLEEEIYSDTLDADFFSQIDNELAELSLL